VGPKESEKKCFPFQTKTLIDRDVQKRRLTQSPEEGTGEKEGKKKKKAPFSLGT